MDKKIKRRSFMGVVAATPLLAFLPKRRRSQPVAAKPPPRWEWEVGEWQAAGPIGPNSDGRRIWQVRIKLLPTERMRLSHSFGYTNAERFCGVPPRHIGMLGIGASLSDNGGLVECEIALEERKCRPKEHRDGIYVVMIRDEPTNFYDLFPGEHTMELLGE